MRATKEAVTFDFGDGPIPAHQLANGAWVADSAAVSDRARVGEGASVGDRARVGAWARVGEGASVGAWARVGDRAKVAQTIRIDRIGSRNAALDFHRLEDGTIHATTGCFYDTLAEFEAKVKATHGDNEHARNYALAIAMVRVMWPEKKKARKRSKK